MSRSPIRGLGGSHSWAQTTLESREDGLRSYLGFSSHAVWRNWVRHRIEVRATLRQAASLFTIHTVVARPRRTASMGMCQYDHTCVRMAPMFPGTVVPIPMAIPATTGLIIRISTHILANEVQGDSAGRNVAKEVMNYEQQPFNPTRWAGAVSDHDSILQRCAAACENGCPH